MAKENKIENEVIENDEVTETVDTEKTEFENALEEMGIDINSLDIGQLRNLEKLIKKRVATEEETAKSNILAFHSDFVVPGFEACIKPQASTIFEGLKKISKDGETERRNISTGSAFYLPFEDGRSLQNSSEVIKVRFSVSMERIKTPKSLKNEQVTK